VPYSSIEDKTIEVSKNEIAAYIKDHKDAYTQEDARDIQFVYFEEKASSADQAAVQTSISKLLANTVEYNSTTDRNDTILGFRATKNVSAFLDKFSDTKFDTIYKAKKDLPALFADTLTTLGIGQIYGPYKEGNFYKLSKMVAKKANGSVKASHILIAYEGATRANASIKRTKAEAEAKAKGLLKDAKKAGTVFVELARDNSDGPSATNGGDLGYFQRGTMVPKFNDFAFGNKTGTIGLVETDFGFHVIKIDDKQSIYQIATVSREIEPSEETINTLFTDATKFEMETINGSTSFLDLAKERNYNVRPVNKIKAMDENLPGLANQRNIVQWAFNEDSNIGDIKRFNINNGYAVVQITATYQKGLMDVEEASASVLPILRKQKKAANIIAANQNKNLDAFASTNNVSVATASALTVKSTTIPGAGNEPIVVGTAFSLGENETSGLIEGASGVFMVQVTKKTDAVTLDNYSTYANSLKTENSSKVNTAVYNALKEGSEITDNRAAFY